MMSANFFLQPLSESSADRERLRQLLIMHYGGEEIVSRGRVHAVTGLQAFLAVDRGTGEVLGFATYRFSENTSAGEVISLDSFRPGEGIGSALLEAVTEAIQEEGYGRAVLVTTNDNLAAVRFFQKRGWRLVAVHLGAVDAARRQLKPQIPLWGKDYLPVRDEWEMQILLEND